MDDIDGWNVSWKSFGKEGGLETCIKELNVHRRVLVELKRKFPRIIVLITFLTDVIAAKRLQDGQKYLGIKESMLSGTEYPSLVKMESALREANNMLKSWYPKTEFVWVIPYPVDLLRFSEDVMIWNRRYTNAEKILIQNESRVLGEFYHHLMDIAESVMDEKYSINWRLTWNREEQYGGPSYDEFRQNSLQNQVARYFNVNATTDGLNPTKRVARGLTRTVREMMYDITNPGKPLPLLLPRLRITPPEEIGLIQPNGASKTQRPIMQRIQSSAQKNGSFLTAPKPRMKSPQRPTCLNCIQEASSNRENIPVCDMAQQSTRPKNSTV